MDNNIYIDKIYEKYASMDKKEDKFFTRNIYKKSYNIVTKLKFILLCIVYISLFTSAAYGAYIVVRNNVVPDLEIVTESDFVVTKEVKKQ